MDLRLGVVLDQSALLAYARLDGLAVGELLGMLAEAGDIAGIPAACLLAAHAALGDDPDAQRRLITLATHADISTAVLPLLSADAVDIMNAAKGVATLIGQHAIIEAIRWNVPLATYEAAAALAEVENVLDLAAEFGG